MDARAFVTSAIADSIALSASVIKDYDVFSFLLALFRVFDRRFLLLRGAPPVESPLGRVMATKFSPTAFSLNSPRPARSKYPSATALFKVARGFVNPKPRACRPAV